MTRKKKHYKPIHIMSSIEHTLALMPKFYPASRCGIIGDTSYNRRKEKKNFQRELRDEGY